MPIPNLDLAEMAVKYVEQNLPFGAESKALDMVHRRMHGQHPKISLQQHRDMRAKLFPGCYALSSAPRENIYATLSDADHALLAQQGNCGEQGALAFKYLYDTRQQKGVGLFSLAAQNPELNFSHVFVVLGLKEEPPGEQYYNAAHYPAGWENAVWCDPWAHEWFEIKEGWPHRVNNMLRSMRNAEAAMKGAILLECLTYYDDDE